MLSELLLDIEELVPSYPESSDSDANWKSLMDQFAPSVFDLGSSIRAAVEAVLGASTFKRSVASKCSCLMKFEQCIGSN